MLTTESQTETQTAVRLKTRALGKRLIVTLPELNDNEEVELIVLRTTPTTQAAPEPEKPKFASALEFLRSLPPRNLTPEQWEKAEREMREERDSWGD